MHKNFVSVLAFTKNKENNEKKLMREYVAMTELTCRLANNPAMTLLLTQLTTKIDLNQ